MKIVELNRIMESLTNKGQAPEEIAGFLEYVIVNEGHYDRTDETALCRENMQKVFPEPMARARIFKRLAISACVEEPEEDDESANAREVNFFMMEMLKSISQACMESDNLTDCKEKIGKLVEED